MLLNQQEELNTLLEDQETKLSKLESKLTQCVDLTKRANLVVQIDSKNILITATNNQINSIDNNINFINDRLITLATGNILFTSILPPHQFG